MSPNLMRGAYPTDDGPRVEPVARQLAATRHAYAKLRMDLARQHPADDRREPDTPSKKSEIGFPTGPISPQLPARGVLSDALGIVPEHLGVLAPKSDRVDVDLSEMKNLLFALMLASCSVGCSVVDGIIEIPGCSRVENLDDACESAKADTEAFSCETNPTREILVCKELDAQKPNIFCCKVE